MDAATAGLIGAFGGAVIGFLGAIKVAADQRVEARRTERRQALTTYLGALYPVVNELREMPPNKEPDLVSKGIDRLRGEQDTWVQTRKGLVAMSPHMFGRMDRLSSAVAQVQLLDMPSGVAEAVDAANEYAAELGEERSDESIARWPTCRQTSSRHRSFSTSGRRSGGGRGFDDGAVPRVAELPGSNQSAWTSTSAGVGTAAPADVGKSGPAVAGTFSGRCVPGRSLPTT